ncbi:hypothetical protein AB0K20_23190 [Micromonospora matsumotoense]|uniref:hypothetical protein n=1 Tax=Micromonospora matsumotoense TaxID=121616 RepID=UPI00342BF4AC
MTAPTEPGRVCRDCGATSGLVMRPYGPLDPPEYECADGCPPLDLDALDALAAAATDGPWTAHPDGLVWSPLIGDPVSGSVLPEDAALIAAARNALPALVAEVRQHRAAQQPTAPAAEPSDRQLLAAAHRWARTHGWRVTWRGWADGLSDGTVGVGWEHGELRIWRSYTTPGSSDRRWPTWSTDYPVASVRQAVDVLVALDVLPAELSSAYRAAVASR